MTRWFTSPRPAAPTRRASLSLFELDRRVQPAVISLPPLLGLGPVAVSVDLGGAPALSGAAPVDVRGSEGPAGLSLDVPSLLADVSGLLGLGPTTGPLIDVVETAVPAVGQTVTVPAQPAESLFEAPPALQPAAPSLPGPTPEVPVPEPLPVGGGGPGTGPGQQSPGGPSSGETSSPGQSADPTPDPAGTPEAPDPAVVAGVPVAPAVSLAGGSASQTPTGTQAAPGDLSQPVGPSSGPATVPAPAPQSGGGTPATLTGEGAGGEQAGNPVTSGVTDATNAVGQGLSDSTASGESAPDFQAEGTGFGPDPGAGATASADSPGAATPDSPVTGGPDGGQGGAASAGAGRSDNTPPDPLPAAGEPQPAPGTVAGGDGPSAETGPVLDGGVGAALAYVAEAAGFPDQVFPQDLSSLQAELDAYLDGLRDAAPDIDSVPGARWTLYALAGAAVFYLETRRAKWNTAADRLRGSARRLVWR